MKCLTSNPAEFLGKKLGKLTKGWVILHHKAGSVCTDGDKLFETKVSVIENVNVLGAGDMFAGEVLYSITSGSSLEKGAVFGCYAASKVVSNVGPRLLKEEYFQIKNNFF